MAGNGKEPAADPSALPRILIEWDEAGAMHLAMEGRIAFDHLVVAAFHLDRLAGGILDQQMAQARNAGSAASPIIPIHGNAADALRSLD